MIKELLGKPSGCLLSSASTSWLREFISNVKNWKRQLHEIPRLEKTADMIHAFQLGPFSWLRTSHPPFSAFLPDSHRSISVFSPSASYLHLVRYFCADGTRMHSCEWQSFTCRSMQSAGHVKGGSEAQGDSYGLKRCQSSESLQRNLILLNAQHSDVGRQGLSTPL